MCLMSQLAKLLQWLEVSLPCVSFSTASIKATGYTSTGSGLAGVSVLHVPRSSFVRVCIHWIIMQDMGIPCRVGWVSTGSKEFITQL